MRTLRVATVLAIIGGPIAARAHAQANGTFQATATVLAAITITGAYQARVGFINSVVFATPFTPPGPSGTATTNTPTGAIYIWLGATLTTTSAAPGFYSAPLTLTVVYN